MWRNLRFLHRKALNTTQNTALWLLQSRDPMRNNFSLTVGWEVMKNDGELMETIVLAMGRRMSQSDIT